MTLSRILAFVRSYAQLSALLWGHRIRRIGKLPDDPVQKQLVSKEQAAVVQAVKNVFNSNLKEYLDQLDGGQFLAAADCSFDYGDINNVFLKGVILDVVESLPSLPSSVYDRVSIYLLAHFMKEEELTLDESRSRVAKINGLCTGTDEYFEWVLGAGRQANRTLRTDLLTGCHNKAHTLQVPSYPIGGDEAQ